MIPFKFFTEPKYIISADGQQVPVNTPIGLLKGYIDHGLPYSRLVPYRVIINGVTYESQIKNSTFNEYVELCRQPEFNIRLCAIVLPFDYNNPNANRVYETWNGIEDRISEYPSEFKDNPNQSFFIEIIKIWNNSNF